MPLLLCKFRPIFSDDLHDLGSHCQCNFPLSPLCSADFNTVMAKDRAEWRRGQWNRSTIHFFITTFLSLSHTHLAPRNESLPSLAELKVMKRTCDGTLETSLLALCLQKLSQLIFFPKELQTYTGSAGSFQVPVTSCSARLRSEVDRPDSAYAFLSWRTCPLCPVLSGPDPPGVSAPPGL